MTQSPVHEARWNLWDAVKVAATYPFFLLLAYEVAAVTWGERDASRAWLLTVGIGANCVAMAGALLVTFRVVRVEKGQTLSELGYTLGDGVANARRALGCYAAMLPLFAGAVTLTQLGAKSVGVKLKTQEIVPVFMAEDSMAVMVGIMVLACIVAPVVEETFFRGFLQPAFRRLVGGRMSILLTALVFALAHRNLAVFLPILVLGLVLGYLYEKTQSLIGSVALHSIHNTVTTSFLLMLKLLPIREVHYTIV